LNKRVIEVEEGIVQEHPLKEDLCPRPKGEGLKRVERRPKRPTNSKVMIEGRPKVMIEGRPKVMISFFHILCR